MNKVLITGGNGYLGSALFNYLIEKNFDVYALVRKSANKESLYLNRVGKDKILFLENIRSESQTITDFDVIIHAATRYKGKYSELINANIEFPFTVLEHFVKKDCVFINIDTSLSPKTNFYSYSKTIFKKLLIRYQSQDSFKIINAELQYFFDEHEPENRFLSSLIRNCLNNESYDLTKGEQIRDFIHMNDICSAIQCLVVQNFRKLDKYKHYEIGTGQGIRIIDLALMVKKMTGSTSILNFGAIDYRKNEPMHSVANTQELMKLGWKPNNSINQSLRNVINAIDSGLD